LLRRRPADRSKSIRRRKRCRGGTDLQDITARDHGIL